MALQADAPLIPFAVTRARNVRKPGAFVLNWKPWRSILISFGPEIVLAESMIARDPANYDLNTGSGRLAAAQLMTQALRNRVEMLVRCHP